MEMHLTGNLNKSFIPNMLCDVFNTPVSVFSLNTHQPVTNRYRSHQYIYKVDSWQYSHIAVTENQNHQGKFYTCILCYCIKSVYH